MIYLRNVMANQEVIVARYYYQRGAYVAAANRANLVVRHFQGTPAMREALVIMVKSYRQMHMTQDANDAMKVLQYNYPNTSVE